MFTIKWFTNATNYRCLAVKEFEVFNRDGGVGVLMSVVGEDGQWDWALEPDHKVYIENAAGKTIDVIRGVRPPSP